MHRHPQTSGLSRLTQYTFVASFAVLAIGVIAESGPVILAATWLMLVWASALTYDGARCGVFYLKGFAIRRDERPRGFMFTLIFRTLFLCACVASIAIATYVTIANPRWP